MTSRSRFDPHCTSTEIRSPLCRIQNSVPPSASWQSISGIPLRSTMSQRAAMSFARTNLSGQ